MNLLIYSSILFLYTFVGANMMVNIEKQLAWMQKIIPQLTAELLQVSGKDQQTRIEQGLNQAAEYWCAEDGDENDFRQFVIVNFAKDQANLDEIFTRFEHLLEKLDGHMNEIKVAFRKQSDLDLGPIYSFDETFAGYNPSAHVIEDFFKNKLAFVVLLNFPLTTLKQRLTEGDEWTRRKWAEVRLTQRFSKRIPANVKLAIAQAEAAAEHYIAEYNIWMHHLIDQNGKRLFQPGLRLLSHWNLRDEIKANYANTKQGFAKQQLIQKVMEAIVNQTIPEVVKNNPNVDWNPYTNTVKKSDILDFDDTLPKSTQINNKPEPDTRYQVLLNTFLAEKKLDPYSPTAPTLIARRFDESREIPEERVKSMFESLLSSPLLGHVAKIIQKRLERPLEPYDIWYNGFRSRGAYTEEELDKIVSTRYPTAKSYEKDMPRLLKNLGFSNERAQYLTNNIVVESARGSGHAWGAEMRSAKARLRTRIAKEGMNYKGFNIAVHEMGHNVEQVFSLNDIDFTLLKGVPNTAFTEALAFVFQDRDLKVLELDMSELENSVLKTINEYWATCEIAAVALVDMGVWHWMYEHPEATAKQLKQATIQIAKDIWNRYYAAVIGKEDVVLLAIYSHMIQSFLYLPDYPIGHLIAVQIESYMKQAENLGIEFERMAKIGNLTPDLWMQQATGSPVSSQTLLKLTKSALQKLSEMK
jgi:hypothetical protein